MPSRRNFVKVLLTVPAIATFTDSIAFSKWVRLSNAHSHKFKLSLNLYSFNAFLREKKVDLFDMLDFCAKHNFDAIDPTGYYFPGYPAVPSDEFIHSFKRKAFILGLDISGTGVRNNFADPDANKRKADIELVKKWIEVSAKMGSPHLRIFAGEHNHIGYSRDQVFEWMATDILECCNYGKQHGVIIALQNHNGFLKTAEDVNLLFEKVNSEWLGLNLDIGSYRQKDPYEEVAKNIHHAVTWQIKENVWINGQEKHTDFKKLFTIIKKAGYRGYLPLETLGEGDPFKKVEDLLKEVKLAITQVE
ncbi:sugar phosphate isomerase/epimerase family protein [uncultured Kriegella sp.]|uniref:sugar phosphate isomerase/epimerase family protein n=1 Tax=uncultured Kriegella sp. TaxID=1798910 RepID=UPI0030DD9A77|tara:strand:+ start:52079 stop:52990 length:912 start_codon:yes stop_codon:yes gene_type:complete